MKLKQKIFALGAGIGLSLPALSALAGGGGSCFRCEQAWQHCQLVLGYTYQQCWVYTGGCVPC